MHFFSNNKLQEQKEELAEQKEPERSCNNAKPLAAHEQQKSRRCNRFCCYRHLAAMSLLLAFLMLPSTFCQGILAAETTTTVVLNEFTSTLSTNASEFTNSTASSFLAEATTSVNLLVAETEARLNSKSTTQQHEDEREEDNEIHTADDNNHIVDGSRQEFKSLPNENLEDSILSSVKTEIEEGLEKPSIIKALSNVAEVHEETLQQKPKNSKLITKNVDAREGLHVEHSHSVSYLTEDVALRETPAEVEVTEIKNEEKVRERLTFEAQGLQKTASKNEDVEMQNVEKETTHNIENGVAINSEATSADEEIAVPIGAQLEDTPKNLKLDVKDVDPSEGLPMTTTPVLHEIVADVDKTEMLNQGLQKTAAHNEDAEMQNIEKETTHRTENAEAHISEMTIADEDLVAPIGDHVKENTPGDTASNFQKKHEELGFVADQQDSELQSLEENAGDVTTSNSKNENQIENKVENEESDLELTSVNYVKIAEEDVTMLPAGAALGSSLKPSEHFENTVDSTEAESLINKLTTIVAATQPAPWLLPHYSPLTPNESTVMEVTPAEDSELFSVVLNETFATNLPSDDDKDDGDKIELADLEVTNDKATELPELERSTHTVIKKPGVDLRELEMPPPEVEASLPEITTVIAHDSATTEDYDYTGSGEHIDEKVEEKTEQNVSEQSKEEPDGDLKLESEKQPKQISDKDTKKVAEDKRPAQTEVNAASAEVELPLTTTPDEIATEATESPQDDGDVGDVTVTSFSSSDVAFSTKESRSISSTRSDLTTTVDDAAPATHFSPPDSERTVNDNNLAIESEDSNASLTTHDDGYTIGRSAIVIMTCASMAVLFSITIVLIFLISFHRQRGTLDIEMQEQHCGKDDLEEDRHDATVGTHTKLLDVDLTPSSFSQHSTLDIERQQHELEAGEHLLDIDLSRTDSDECL